MSAKQRESERKIEMKRRNEIGGLSVMIAYCAKNMHILSISSNVYQFRSVTENLVEIDKA